MDRNDVLAVSALLELVALRKESVDRNVKSMSVRCSLIRSLSARRAWIEIVKLFRQNYECFVALRKESVDRNVIDNVHSL